MCVLRVEVRDLQLFVEALCIPLQSAVLGRESERERQRVKNEEMGARERGGEGGEETWRK